MKRLNQIGVLAALAGLLALGACSPSGEAAATAPQPGPMVEIAVVQAAQGAGVIRASGIVGYKIETPLSFNAAGVVRSILVDEGDEVRRGQRLATLQRTGAAGDTSETALARQNAERDLARTEALFERGFASQAALDDARLAVSRARDSAVITAPSAGIVLRRLAEPAQIATTASPILIVGDVTSGIVVRASAPSGDAARVRIGDRARVSGADLAAPLEGEVSRISAKSDDVTGAFEIEVRLADPGTLRSGMVANVEILSQAIAGDTATMIAPALALLDARADQGIVYVVDAENIARRRAVQTAGLVDGGVLIVSGLEPGERIVAAGAAYVRDGEPVRPAQSQE